MGLVGNAFTEKCVCVCGGGGGGGEGGGGGGHGFRLSGVLEFCGLIV